MAFTEFCCRSGGSNLNAGTRTGSSTEPGTSADLTYASGSWVASTGVFTVASGNPTSDGVAVGDFASVYVDGSSVTGFVGRVTAQTSTTITVSLTVRMGAAPTDGTSNRTLKIGGAWQGPNGSSAFPFTLASWSAAQNTSASPARINLKNDQTYSITSGITIAVDGGQVQGYTSAYCDGGRATIDGGTSVIDVVSLTRSSSLFDLVIKNNAASGTNRGLIISGSGNGSPVIFGVVCSGHRDAGFRVLRQAVLIECEAFGNCTSNSANGAGFQFTFGTCLRCISHDNTGSNSYGFGVTASGGYLVAVDCIADTNGSHGFFCLGVSTLVCSNCVSYSNGGDGFRNDGTSGVNIGSVYVDNAIATKNGGYGQRYGAAASPLIGALKSNAYGTGTQANTSGQTLINAAAGVEEASAVTLTTNADPFTDAANGDFRVTSSQVKGTGRGSFTQTAASYAGTVGYPDIGAAQSAASGSSGIPIARGMHGGMR
jgi:hypothetical protein